MKVLGLISSYTHPSSRARILQYKPYFTRSIELTIKNYLPERESNPAGWTRLLKKITGVSEWRTWDAVKTIGRLSLLKEQANYDLIWQNRLVMLHHSFFEKKIKKPVVFDFDDAIWMSEGKNQVNEALQRSAAVFAGNDYLAEYAKRFNQNVHIIPTTVDVERLKPLQKKHSVFTVGWIGTESNFKYLEMIKAPVIEFLEKNKDARLIIISSKPPSFFSFDGQRTVFKKWDESKENEMINEFDIGLMPLADDEWTRGKCSYKMLQYLACGKPAVVSPVGNNKTILEKAKVGLGAGSGSNWLQCMHELKNNGETYNEFSVNGRQLVAEEYASNIWSEKIITLFREMHE
jgi:glycosyltransferase involved in cell wall biosynthesis